MKLYLLLAAMVFIPQVSIAKTDEGARPSPYTGLEVMSAEIEKHGYLLVSFINTKGKPDDVKCARYSKKRALVPTRKSQTAKMKPICDAGLKSYLETPYTEADILGGYLDGEDRVNVYVSDRQGEMIKIDCADFVKGTIQLTSAGNSYKNRDVCVNSILAMQDKKWKTSRDLPQDMQLVSEYVKYYKQMYKNRISNTVIMEKKLARQNCQVRVIMNPLSDKTFEAQITGLLGSDVLCEILKSSIEGIGIFKKPESDFMSRRLKELVFEFEY
ncbi:hypothetical protein [Vibrio coralliilyticus]|uniref:hypothetical protein n=1 Tax=Vibrio coralliilyticus TaxID=190893 RepID=UPI000BAC18EC|nr:hypothetical protein [Vibrio coralliilyticus]PAW02300.1 hypothetical protein CKJ79_16700 [Vibrio coralliilyticus]